MASFAGPMKNEEGEPNRVNEERLRRLSATIAIERGSEILLKRKKKKKGRLDSGVGV